MFANRFIRQSAANLANRFHPRNRLPAGAVGGILICLTIVASGIAGCDGKMDNSATEFSDLVEKVDAIREKYGMASAYLVLVDRDQTLLSRGMGIKAWNDPQPVTADNFYRLGSVTKAFTGLALLRAEEQGCLKLTDPVPQGATPPVVTNRWSDTDTLTIAMLMEHTAGIHEMSVDEFAFNDPVTLEEALWFRPNSRITAWPPGLHSEYSNSGPGMAGWLIQQGCNTDFDRYIQENVFAPLRMPSATLLRTPEVISNLVGGYNTDPKEPINYWHFIFRPAGAANVRPAEMGNFLRMLINWGTLDGETVFTEAQIRRMETPTTTAAARAGLDYGYGLGIRAATRNGRVYYGHSGDADGYLSRFAYNRESGRGFYVVITMFDFQPMREIRDLLENWMLQDLTPIVPHNQPALKDEVIDAVTGTYERATIRFPTPNWQRDMLVVSRRGQRIGYDCDDGEWCELIPVAENFFRLVGEPVATTAFVSADGEFFLQGEMGNWRKRDE